MAPSADRQTSHKAGSRSIAQKESGVLKYPDRSAPNTRKVAGAFGREGAPPAERDVRGSSHPLRPPSHRLDAPQERCRGRTHAEPAIVMERIGQNVVVFLPWHTIEPEAQQQILNTAKMPFVFKHVAVMPDCHYGKGATVGTVLPTKGAVIPAAVGVDIGCGMIAVERRSGVRTSATRRHPRRHRTPHSHERRKEQRAVSGTAAARVEGARNGSRRRRAQIPTSTTRTGASRWAHSAAETISSNWPRIPKARCG